MLHGTISEIYFERFCDDNRIPFLRITPNGVPKHKHPDYRITCSGHEVIVEVKEVGESKARSTLRKQLELNGPNAIPIPRPDDQVGRMLRSGSKQIKCARGKYPALIILFDDQSIIPIDAAAIHAGLYRRGERTDLALSAVGLLTAAPDKPVHLDFFHHTYGTIPFNPDWLRCAQATHYRVAGLNPLKWEIFQ